MPRQRQGESDEEFRARANEYMKARYYRRRSAAVEQLGGVCVDCGSVEGLEFDHVDAKSKTVAIGGLFASGADSKVQAELKKCVLRCGTCHLRKSIREADVPLVGHGQGKTGKRHCICELCAPLKASYNANRKKAVQDGTWTATHERPHIKPL